MAVRLVKREIQKSSLSMITILVALSLVPLDVAGNQKTRYTSTVPMSSDDVSLAGVCVSTTASMTSPEFEGLERIDSPSGIEFRRSKKLVRKFPELVDVQVWAIPAQCNSQPSTYQSPDIGLETLLDNLSFRFSWKRGMELHPAGTADFVKKHFAKRNIWFFPHRNQGNRNSRHRPPDTRNFQ
jgi:hypothetical protein